MNENGIENNSIKILNSVSNDSEKLKEQLNLLVQAKKNADEAIKEALNCFDQEDDNKANIEKVLNSGANDINTAKGIIEEFIKRLDESNVEWKKAEQSISDSIADALREAMQRDGIQN